MNLKFSQLAIAKVKEFMQSTGKNNMSLRIEVKEKTKDGFKYQFTLEDYDQERTNDVYVREGGFSTRIDPESSKWLKGATVDWTEKDSKVGFCVHNPNSPVPSQSSDLLKQDIIEALKTIFDPEIPVNIYELGLIYDIAIDENKEATVTMTLTAPNCPAAEMLPEDVRKKTSNVPGILNAKVNITWEPPWDKNMMSEAAKLQLGI